MTAKHYSLIFLAVIIFSVMSSCKKGDSSQSSDENDEPVPENGYVEPYYGAQDISIVRYSDMESSFSSVQFDRDNCPKMNFSDEETKHYEELFADFLAKQRSLQKTVSIYDDEFGYNGFPGEYSIVHELWNSGSWGQASWGDFKTSYVTENRGGEKYIVVIFFKKGGFKGNGTAYLKLGTLYSDRFLGRTEVHADNDHVVIRYRFDNAINGYGCLNIFPLVEYDSMRRSYDSPIFISSNPMMPADWKKYGYGDVFGTVNGINLYCNNNVLGFNSGDGDYQATDFAKRSLTTLFNLRRQISEPWGNSFEWPDNRRNDSKDKYLVMDNDGTSQVREGDMLVYDKFQYTDLNGDEAWSNGHIAMVIHVSEKSILVAHQNGGSNLYESYNLPIGTELALHGKKIIDEHPESNQSPIYASKKNIIAIIRVYKPEEEELEEEPEEIIEACCLLNKDKLKSAVPYETATKLVFEYKKNVDVSKLTATGKYVDDKENNLQVYCNGTEYYVLSENDGEIIAPEDCSWLCGINFDVSTSFVSISFVNFNTEKVTDMGEMFAFCPSLTSLDVSSFSTENVTSTYRMFFHCESLERLDISNFNTENVTSMNAMFCSCYSLTSLDVSSFNTENVTTMYCMFWNCSSLTSLDVSHFNTENVTDMTSMFDGCSSLTSLDVSNFKTENVTSMYGMFANCEDLKTIYVSKNFKYEQADIRNMFTNCPATGNYGPNSQLTLVQNGSTIEKPVNGGTY